MTPPPRHLRPTELPPFAFREHTFRFLIEAADSGGSYSLLEIESPAGTGPNPHVHETAEEGFYLLAGEATFHVGDTVITARPGDWVHVPRGASHHFTAGPTAVRYLALYAPAGEEQLFREATSSDG